MLWYTLVLRWCADFCYGILLFYGGMLIFVCGIFRFYGGVLIFVVVLRVLGWYTDFCCGNQIPTWYTDLCSGIFGFRVVC